MTTFPPLILKEQDQQQLSYRNGASSLHEALSLDYPPNLGLFDIRLGIEPPHKDRNTR